MKALQYSLVAWALSAGAQVPDIARNGVLNAASHTPPSLINAAAARGALLTIRGSRLGARVADVSVRFSGKSGAADLTVVSAGPSELTVRLPADAPLGPASLTVAVQGWRSLPYQIQIVSTQFGIYAANGKGWGPGRMQNLTGSQRAPNTITNAADFLQVVALSGTGLGDSSKPVVTVGGKAAKVIAARSSRGADEILFQVPPDAPEGCFVPVQVLNAGLMPSNTVTVAIHEGGGACQAPEYFPFAGWSGTRFGMLAITRTVEHIYSSEPVSDEIAAWFGQLPGIERVNPYFVLPPAGTCTSEVEVWRGGFVPASLIGLLASRAEAKALRAGDELTIDDGKTVRRVLAFHGLPGVFDRELSDLMGRADQLLHFVSPVELHVSAKGGADVGRFRTSVTGPRPFAVREFHPPERGRPLHLEWEDMGAGNTPIVFANFVDEVTGSRGMCYCVGRPGETGLTIPASTLAYFPAATRDTRFSLTIAAWPLRPVVFKASGLDHAVALSVFMQNLSVSPVPSTFRQRN